MSEQDFKQLLEKTTSVKINEEYDDDDIREFEAIMWRIKKLVDQAYEITKSAGGNINARAKAYWYPTIVGLVDAGAGYSGSMVNMYDTLNELEEDQEMNGNGDYDPLESVMRKKKPVIRRTNQREE